MFNHSSVTHDGFLEQTIFKLLYNYHLVWYQTSVTEFRPNFGTGFFAVLYNLVTDTESSQLSARLMQDSSMNVSYCDLCSPIIIL